MFINTALAALGLALLLLLIAQVMNRLMPHWTARVYRARRRKRAGLSEAVQPLQAYATPYLHGGQGEVLVLLHDFAGGKDRFIEVAHHLKDSMRVLIPDMPGHGEGDKDPQAVYSIAAQVQRIRDFVQAQGLQRVHLGGNGMGGCVAAWYAARYPDEVASVWLLNASATHDAWQAPWVMAYDATGQCPLLVQTSEQQKAKLELLTGESRFVLFCLLHTWAAAGARDFALHHTILKTLRQTPPLEQHFSGLLTPALIVGGELDRIVPPASVKTLAKVFTRAQTIVVQDMGHVPHIEAPAQTAQDYLAFRAKLAAGAQRA